MCHDRADEKTHRFASCSLTRPSNASEAGQLGHHEPIVGAGAGALPDFGIMNKGTLFSAKLRAQMANESRR